MARAGISSAQRDTGATYVVAYDDAGGANAARVWWLLHYFGHDSVSLLDGGWNQWLTERRTVSTHVPEFPRGKFYAQPHPHLAVNKAEMVELIRNPQVLILDARAPERYAGQTEPVDARAGHIPGAQSAPLAGNLYGSNDFRFQNAQALRARFDALGANGADRIVAYCGSGVNAAADLFALHLAGYDNTQLYAGSFSEWSRDPDLPVIQGAEPY
jgi:thiosulfate/3-mercaptopyruvate sulfurtransferase